MGPERDQRLELDAVAGHEIDAPAPRDRREHELTFHQPSTARGVSAPVVLDGSDRPIERAYGEPMEICAQIRPAV